MARPLAGSRKTPAVPLEGMAGSFDRALDAEHKSPRTRTAYLAAIQAFTKYLREKGLPEDIGANTPDHLQDFFAYCFAAGYKPASVHNRFRALKTFFAWAVRAERIPVNPMGSLRPPHVPETPVAVLTLEEIARILDTCRGRDFDAVRDTALIRLFLDTGARRAEIANLTMDDVDMDGRTVHVIGKGSRPRVCPFGVKAAVAMDRYIHMRGKHTRKASPEFWLGHEGPMTENGIYQVIRRRGRQAGIEGLGCHAFRHFWAHDTGTSGLSDSDRMRLAGWKTSAMLQRYAASTADERARENYRKIGGPGDKI